LNCKELGDLLQEIRKREKGDHLQESQMGSYMDAIDRQKTMQAAAEAQEQAEAEEIERARERIAKRKSTATADSAKETPEGCVAGLSHTCEDLGGELRRIWMNRHDVFLPVFNQDDVMAKMAPEGRKQVICGVFKAIAEYDKMPYGLRIPPGAMDKICPELSEAATKSMCSEPSRFASLVTRVVSEMPMPEACEKAAVADLWSRRADLTDLYIEVGGFKVPFDEEKPVTYLSGDPLPKGHQAVFGFGNRVELYAVLRNLFIRQSLFMAIRAVLAKAYELGILTMEEVAGENKANQEQSPQVNAESLDVDTTVKK